MIRKLESFEVRRVTTNFGGRIEPALVERWDAATKLAWHASVVAHDTGLNIEVYGSVLRVKRRWSRRWRRVPNRYGVRIDSSTVSPMTLPAAWDFLSGVSVGAARARARGGRPRTGDAL